MAKKSMIAKNEQRKATVAKYAARREELKAIQRDPSSSMEAKLQARDDLNELPKDASPVRVRQRGGMTGRPRGTLRRFQLDRIAFREKALNGELPGIRKASW